MWKCYVLCIIVVYNSWIIKDCSWKISMEATHIMHKVMVQGVVNVWLPSTNPSIWQKGSYWKITHGIPYELKSMLQYYVHNRWNNSQLQQWPFHHLCLCGGIYQGTRAYVRGTSLLFFDYWLAMPHIIDPTAVGYCCYGITMNTFLFGYNLVPKHLPPQTHRYTHVMLSSAGQCDAVGL